MAVVASTNAVLTAYNRRIERSPQVALPIARWSGDLNPAGDASGGDVARAITQTRAISGKYVWSVEEVQVDHLDAVLVARTFLLSWSTGIQLTNGTQFSSTMHGTTTISSTAGVGSTAQLRRITRSENVPPLPEAFMWQRKTNLLSLVARIANVATTNYGMTAWGWCWERAAFDQGQHLVRPH